MYQQRDNEPRVAAAAPPSVAWRWLLVLAAAVLLAAGVSTGRAQAAGLGAGIHVTGTGVVNGEPDTAQLELGVSTVAEDVKTAMAEADGVMNAVREAVVAAGVAEEDIVTTSLYVFRDERTDRDGNTTATRFQVRHSYRVTVRDIDAVGEVLAAVVEAGANEVGGITFTLSDPAALAGEARALALADARQRAEGLAEAAGVTLGAPVAISELNVMPVAAFRQEMALDAASSAVATGQLAITVSVQVSYGLE